MTFPISLIIPAYNEERRLSPTLQSIAQWMREPHGEITIVEILIVDDGSTDATNDVALSFQKSLPIHVLRFPRNRGKGAAIKAGIHEAKGEWLLLFDADSATPIEELATLVDEQKKSGASIVIGSRVADASSVAMSRKRRCIGRIYHALTAPLIPGIRDASCGFKLLQADVARELFASVRTDGYGYDVEFLSRALRKEMRIAEVQVSWKEVAGSKVRLLRDGMRMFGSACSLSLQFLFHRV